MSSVPRLAALERFKAAVRDGRQGDYRKAKEIVESVRARWGDSTAEICKRELWMYMKSDKPC